MRGARWPGGSRLLCPDHGIETHPTHPPKMLPRELWVPEFSGLPRLGAREGVLGEVTSQLALKISRDRLAAE